MRPPRPTPRPPPPPAPDIVPRRRSRKPARRSRISSSHPDLSPGLLALVVTVAGSSPVHARPLQSDIPPDFLCPRLHQSPQSQPISSADPSSSAWAACHEPQTSPSAKSKSSASSILPAYPFSSSRKKRARGGNNNIADKYEQSPDGRWRKADSWELYGSTSCAITQCMDSTATAFPVQEDQVSPSGELETTSVSTSASSTPSLPNGWGKRSDADEMTGMILALSLCLAFALILFMTGIVLWRKKRRKDAEADAEKNASTSDPNNEEASEEVMRARSQQRMWARAYARWMANVRQSARRRRKRQSTVAAKGSDTGPLHDRLMPSAASSSGVSLSRTHTTTDIDSSHWSRTRSVRSRSLSRTRSRSSSAESSRSQPRGDVSPPQSPHPPAYISDASQSRLFHRNPVSRTLPQTSHVPPPSSASHSSPLPPAPYEPAVHAAHVATDDKTILARMAQAASAPPHDALLSPDAAGGTSEVYPSVPLLEDDGFEPLPPELRCDVDADPSGESTARRPPLAHDVLSPVPDMSSPYLYPNDSEVPSYTEDALRHPPLVLPPPPSKVPLTGPMFYEYPNEFEEDVATMEPPPGPSSPPFEEPSAPPFEDITSTEGVYMVASAPPLDLADGFPHSSEWSIPSAPPLDLDELAVPLEADTGASGLEGRASPSAPDDHGNVNAIPSAVFSCETPRLGDASPPLYLP